MAKRSKSSSQRIEILPNVLFLIPDANDAIAKSPRHADVVVVREITRMTILTIHRHDPAIVLGRSMMMSPRDLRIATVPAEGIGRGTDMGHAGGRRPRGELGRTLIKEKLQLCIRLRPSTKAETDHVAGIS
jgi:hypothetical protein